MKKLTTLLIITAVYFCALNGMYKDPKYDSATNHLKPKLIKALNKCLDNEIVSNCIKPSTCLKFLGYTTGLFCTSMLATTNFPLLIPCIIKTNLPILIPTMGTVATTIDVILSTRKKKTL